MRHPVDSVRITQDYGWTKYALDLKEQGSHAYDVFGDIHGGVDYGDKQFTRAVGPGYIISVGTGYNGGWGNRVDQKLTDYDDLTALYCHLERIDVTPKQRITEGQEIGLMGNTGASTGTHLHLSLYRGVYRGSATEWVNPLDYINKENHMNCAQKDIRFNFDPSDGSVWIINKGKRYKAGTKPDDFVMLFAKFAGENISPEEKNYPITTNRKDVL